MMLTRSLLCLLGVLVVAHCSNKTNENGDKTIVLHPLASVEQLISILKDKREYENCTTSLQALVKNVEEWDLDAMKLIDSWGKPHSGILDGNVNQYGNFDECLISKIKHNGGSIDGKYCLVSLELKVPESLKTMNGLIFSHYNMRKGCKEFGHRLPHFSDFKWGSCIPSGCPSEIVEMLINRTSVDIMGKIFEVNAIAQEEMCYTKDDSLYNEIPRLPWIYFGTIFLLAVIGTLSSSFQRKIAGSSFLECFSLTKNWNELFLPTKNEVPLLHGIKTTSALALLLSHKNMAMLYNPYNNRTTMSEILGKPWSVIGRTAIIYTDGFILLSGYLSGRSFSKEIEYKGHINLIKSTFSRYWRLVPNLITVVIFCTYILPNMSSGPQWNMVVRKHAQLCKTSWWKNVLFVHNFFGFENMCLTHTHQLGIDFQLFLISPVVVYTLWKWPKMGCIISFVLAIMSTVLRYIVTYYKNLSVVIYFGVPVSQLLDTANNSYILPHHRLTVYLMGVGVVFFLRKFPTCIFSNLQVAVLWIIAGVCGLAAMCGPYHMALMDYSYNAQEAAIFNSLSPILWGTFIGWTIVANTYGYAGWLGKLMSWTKFQIFSKLSYSIYLVQFPIFFYYVGIRRHSVNYSLSVMFSLEEYALILISSVVLTLMVEMPANNLRSLYLKQGEPPKIFPCEKTMTLGKETTKRKVLKQG